MTPTDRAARDLRRRVLLQAAAGLVGGLAVGVASAGCSLSDPRIEDGREPGSAAGSRSAAATPVESATPSPGPLGALRAAQLEEHAAALAAGVLIRPKTKLTAGQRRLAGAVRDAHQAHAVALRSADPTARPTGPAPPMPAPPTPAPKTPPMVSLGALVAAERSLAAQHARLVPGARGLTAQLWGSLSVAASTFASALGTADGAPVVRTPSPLPTPTVPSDMAGIQALVAQLHAMVYGYQLALGRLQVASREHARAVAGLADRRLLRDRLISILIAHSADVPAAQPAYVPPIKVVGPRSAAALLAGMETALLPYAGQFLAAAARDSDQRLAWSALQDTGAIARRWGGPVQAWPGWPS